ncbi:MAG: hypothetical protein QOK40_2474 [Miltoncostaeaceae bacterium]|jgi:hypothetical protein|nr:hypothetical protein [Miltoncostaeaceae bacterium]
MTTNDFVASTTAATTTIQEAGRDASVAVLNATIEGQERALRLARTILDESQTATAQQKQLFESIGAQVKKGQDAAVTLAQSYLAGSAATMYFPFALADQLGRSSAN